MKQKDADENRREPMITRIRAFRFRRLPFASLGFRTLLWASLGFAGCASDGPAATAAQSSADSAPSSYKLSYWATYLNRKENRWQGVYQVFLAKAWQKTHGYRVEDPLFEIATPQTRVVDDDMMRFLYREVLLKHGFFEFPIRRLVDLDVLQRQDAKKWILMFETEGERRIIDRDDLVIPPTPDVKGQEIVQRRLQDFTAIQENLVHLGNLYPVYEIRTDREDPARTLPIRKLLIESDDAARRQSPPSPPVKNPKPDAPK